MPATLTQPPGASAPKYSSAATPEQRFLRSRLSRQGRRLLATFAGAAGVGLLAAAPGWASGGPIITDFAGTGGFGTPAAGPAVSSALANPQAVAVDSSGNVYICDTLNQEIEKITPNGTLSVIAGNGQLGTPTPGPATSSKLFYPQGVAVDSHGNVYIADTFSNTIDKVTPAGTLSIFAGDGSQGAAVAGPATSSPLGSPMGVAVDSSDDVLIADTLNYTIDKVTPDGTLSVIAGNGSHGAATDGPALSSELVDPEYVGTDPNGNVYIGDTGGNEIEKLTPNGQLTIIAGTGAAGAPTPGLATASRLNYPENAIGDAEGDVYIADTNDSDIVEIDPSGNLSIIAGLGHSAAPTYGGLASASGTEFAFNLALDPGGTALYVVDISHNTIDRIGLATPGAPSEPVLTAGDGDAQFTFNPPTDLGTSTVSGYEYSLDNGVTWHALSVAAGSGGALSATVANLTDGTPYSVEVRAVNGAGPGTASAAGSVTPQAPAGPVSTTTTTTPSTTTATTPTTTTTTTTTPTPMPLPVATPSPVPVTTPSAPNVVTLPTQVIQTGLSVSTAGQITLPLQCPATATGCDADGTLSMARPVEQPALQLMTSSSADVVIARFVGVKIASGQSRLLSVRLTAGAIAALQKLAIRRVRVTLATDNHLNGGAPVLSTQNVWLRVPPVFHTCPVPGGAVAGTHLGPVSLGESRVHARQLLPRFHPRNYHTDDFCLAAGPGVRVGYGSNRLLGRISRVQRRAASGRIVLALTANRHYALDGVRPGDALSSAARLTLEPALRLGLNTWYIVPGAHCNGLLKVRRGTVLEIGIVNRQLTNTRADQAGILRYF